MIKHLTDFQEKDKDGISLRDAVIYNALKDIPKIQKDSDKSTQLWLGSF